MKIRLNRPDCVLIFDPEKDFFHEFNSTASEVLLMVKKGSSKDKIIETIAAIYGLSIKEAEKEVSSFFNKLIKLGVAYEK